MRGLTVAAVGLALVVVVLGAYTRLADAGLGCPDWPGCYGHLGVPDTEAEVQAAEAQFPDAPVEADKAWIEMVHRYFATALGALILGMVIVTFRIPNGVPGGVPRALPAALLALVILQGAFGAWTVTLKLWPQVVTAHLLGGFATLALLWLLALRLGIGPKDEVAARFGRLATVALVVVVAQVALGGWVTSNYAALACPDFPTCHGDWVPAMDFQQGFDVLQTVGPNYLGGLLDSEARIAIQFAHRLGAVAVLAAVGLLGWRLWQAGSPLAPWVLGLLAVQWTLGILNVLLNLPLAVATAHNGCGALLLLALVTVREGAFQDNRRPITGANSE
ncbi:MAG: heme A synthase [Gammaproteobacteria bacterium]|nr:heme A synthase [Gammaproteobacteria bacterium]